MLAELSKFLELSQHADIVTQLKFLELEIPIDQQISLVQQVFRPASCEFSNSKHPVLIGEAVHLDLIQHEENKPLLCEYLDMQFMDLQAEIRACQARLDDLKRDYDSASSLAVRNQLKEIIEDAQKSLFQIKAPQSFAASPESAVDVIKEQFTQTVRDQKQLATYHHQVQSLHLKVTQEKKRLFDAIAEQNEDSEAYLSRVMINIENELKLIEKSTELKLLSKIEQDLTTEFIALQKQEQGSRHLDGLKGASNHDDQLHRSLNKICEIFGQIKEQKIKNNDFINESVLKHIDFAQSQCGKIASAQEQNTHQLIDYLIKCPNEQWVIQEESVQLLDGLMQDYQFVQAYKQHQQKKTGDHIEQIDEFLRLTAFIKEQSQQIQMEQSQFQAQWDSTKLKLQSIEALISDLREVQKALQ